jgi:ATP-binding cassette subfamily F protein uup
LSKSFSARALFSGISFGLDEDERLGLIGPNGSGKSTLLKILAGLEDPDTGVVSARRGLRVGYVAQDEEFAAGKSVADVLADAMAGETWDETERATRRDIVLAKVGFTHSDQDAGTLSGGWRKRLAIARELIREPSLLLLDEPTNHLDLEGVLWLETLLQNAVFAFVVVSHDRQFLENIAGRVMELNAAYADGYLSSDGAYSDFLVKRQEFLAAQAHQEHALATKVTREIAWLRRGARARTTKAKAASRTPNR